MTLNQWRTAIAATALSVAPLGAAPALAHHSYSLFDSQKNMTLEGTVREFQWTNPHTWIQLAVKDASGREVEWSIEGASPNSLARQGWSRKAIKPGDRVTVVVHPLKDGTAGGSLISATVNGQPIGSHS